MAAKNKIKKQEPDLFTAKESAPRKQKEWKFPRGVKYPDVKVGDIFVFSQSRNWNHGGEIVEARGVLIEKGKIDAKTQYFKVKMISTELQSIEDEDIRRYIITKK